MMETLLLKANEQEDVQRAGEILRRGGIVAIPTETVYGLAADATSGQAVSKIFEAKGRPQDNPLIVHIASLEDLPPLVEQVPPMAEKLAQSFWPGPLTMVFRKSPRVPQEITAGLETVAIRMPQHPAARDVIRAAGVPLAAPSANRSGKPSPTTAAHVMEDMKGRIEAVLDGGECSVGVESTVVDMTGDVPRILRPGAITQKQLKRVLGKNVEIDEAVFHEVAPGQPVRSPGMKYRHYAPKAPVLLFVGAPDVTARAIEQEMQPHDAVLCFDEYHDFYDDEKGPVRTYGPSCDKQAQGQQLFAALRDLDATSCQRILAQAPRPFGEGLAVSNRIHKAAGFQVVRPAKAQVVGITGTSGSGKSSVGACLQQMGWQIIDADQVYHQLLKLDRNLTRTVLNQFPAVAGPDGTVDRKALSRIVFEDRMELRRLNAITHPAVKREIRRRIRVLTSQGCSRIGLDVPLLYESGLDHVCDFVIGVVASEPALTERIVRRDGISPEQARIRLASQPDRQFYEALCDILIENDGDEEALCRNLKESLPQMEEAEKK